MTLPERPNDDLDQSRDDPELDEVAGDRGGQPGYDLDEGKLYEGDEGDDTAA